MAAAKTARHLRQRRVDQLANRPGMLRIAERHGDGDDGMLPGLHPFVQSLLRELAKAGDVWPEAQRKLWLATAASIFKTIDKDCENGWATKVADKCKRPPTEAASCNGRQAASASHEKNYDDDHQYRAEASANIMEWRPHIETTTAEQKNQNNQE